MDIKREIGGFILNRLLFKRKFDPFGKIKIAGVLIYTDAPNKYLEGDETRGHSYLFLSRF